MSSYYSLFLFFFLRIRRPPKFTRTATLLPDTTPFRPRTRSPGSKPRLRPRWRSNAPPRRTASPPNRADARRARRYSGRSTHYRDHQRDRHEIDRSRSEEHTSELQSLMRISYAVFCLKKKKKNIHQLSNTQST